MAGTAFRRGRVPAQPAPRRSRARIESIVLDHLAGATAPLSAYEISWRAGMAGDPIVPNQVYRTLARLIAEGRVCRLESLSAYMLKAGDTVACLICDQCRATRLVEAPDVIAGLERCTRDMAFKRAGAIVEIHGNCADCAAAPSGDAAGRST